ncbi:MAG: hypothetical protein JRD84_07320 [Deltaproteobacteria bacterium]|nr:hypothetical protein [Deltaproteobacteria bacterium]
MLQAVYVKKVPLSTKMGGLFDTAISAATLPLGQQAPDIAIAASVSNRLPLLPKALIGQPALPFGCFCTIFGFEKNAVW